MKQVDYVNFPSKTQIGIDNLVFFIYIHELLVLSPSHFFGASNLEMGCVRTKPRVYSYSTSYQ